MERIDKQFDAFVRAYPPARRQGGYMAQCLFLDAVTSVGFDGLMSALQQHCRSVQWQDPKMIPMLHKWLDEKRWLQVLPEVESPAVDEKRAWARLTPMEQARRLGLK